MEDFGTSVYKLLQIMEDNTIRRQFQSSLIGLGGTSFATKGS